MSRVAETRLISPEATSLRLSPEGHLRASLAEGPDVLPAIREAIEAFQRSAAEGLFELAARHISGGLPGELAYWRDFAALYLTAVCHTPEGAELSPVPAPGPDRLAEMALSAPPMLGAEYLTPDVLERLWTTLDEWLRAEAHASGGLEAFLTARAPRWRQVGRVCFHLAENKKDPAFPFAFLATYAPRLSTQSGAVTYQPLSRALLELAGERNRKALVHLLTPIQKAAERSALISSLVETHDIYHPLAWTSEEAYRFLQEVPLYEESGLLVRVPNWWSTRARPVVDVRIGSESVGVLGLDAVLQFEVDVAVGGERLSAKELKALLSGMDGLVFLKGRWVEVDRQKLSDALAHWKTVEEQGLSLAEGMRLLAGAPRGLSGEENRDISDWSKIDASGRLRDILERLRSPESEVSTLPGPELRATLRHYQETGVKWLRLVTELGLGGCLADDMGLGKTIQVLALLLLLKKRNAGPSVLVLPSSLLANWKLEIERFAPSLRTLFLHPAFEGDSEERQDLDHIDIVLTSYGMLARRTWLEEVDWMLVVLDEAQAIKNPGAKQTRMVKRLNARARIALTGTPVENRLSDLWSLFDFLCPGLLGTSARFKEFAKALAELPGERYAPLRNLVRPYILRRLKTDRTVISDLPDKTEVPAYCGLTKYQAALYSKIVDELSKSIRDSEGMDRRGLILATLMKLKQVCNHPSHFRGDGQWKPEESGKFARLAEIAEEIASRQDRVLVFTQFREMTEPLAAFLAGVFGRSGLVLHGQTPVKDRQRLVQAFQEEGGPPFFVLSLKAGGTGLNLTAASHVVHFDRWWNPAVENQATDRAFRIGQKKNVLVHSFVCRGTVEERIDEMIRAKLSLARDLLEGGGEALLTEMSNDELMATVRLDVNKASALT